MAIKTLRSSLYYIDPAEDEVVTVGCVTSLTGIEASRDQLETTCLEDSARSYEAGLGTPGTKTFTINFDPADASHVRVYNLWRAGTKVLWALGLGDGPPAPAALVPPTYASDGGFNLPDTRSWIVYEGYVANVPLDLSLNSMLTANVSVQISDFPTLVERTAT
jgi:hypothetical protein